MFQGSKAFLSAAVACAALTFWHGAPAEAQQTCAEIDAVVLQCPDPAGISGAPPLCQCEGIPVDPLELTCAANFGCASGDEVANGDWPDCACSAPGPGSGGGGPDSGLPGPGVELGGGATCDAFFECPQGAEMEVIGGRCSCTIIVLPEVK